MKLFMKLYEFKFVSIESSIEWASTRANTVLISVRNKLGTRYPQAGLKWATIKDGAKLVNYEKKKAK